MAYQGYQGAQGYDPERGAVDRKRQLADLLQQRAMETGPKSFAEGISQIGQALLARGAMQSADTAETAYSDNRKKAADALISTMYPGAQANAQAELAQPAAFDLTPSGTEQRAATNGIGDKVRSLAAYLGDPMAAIQAGQGMQAQQTADLRYKDERDYGRGRDLIGDQRWQTQFDYQGQRDKTGDAQWQSTFDRGGEQFDATMGHNSNVLGETRRHNMATEGLTAQDIAVKAATATTKPTPMQTAVDKNWADDLVNWQINGAANFGKQMTQLDGAVKRLKGGEELTGPGTTLLPGPMRDWFGQAGKDVQQQIQEIVQGSLREVLGAQFTQKEGEGIMARTFDPTLEEGVNAQRAERLIAQLQLAAQQKNKALEYYNANGTMNGYQGHVPSVADFTAAIASAPAGADYIVAPNGQQFPKEQATAVRNFMATLPPNLQDPGFMSQLDAVLGGSEPTTDDLVSKWLK